MVSVIGNSNVALNAQVGTIKGNFEMTGGSVGFPVPMGTITDGTFAWFTFKVNGDVKWSGGNFVTGIQGATNGGKAHLWEITGKLTVGANAKIVVANVGGGQQVNGTWDVILYGAVQDATLPSTDAGWTAEKIPNKDGIRVKK